MAYQFDGSTQYLTAPLTVSAYPLTFFARANPASFTTFPSVIGIDNSGNSTNQISLYYDSTGAGRAGIENGILATYVTSSNTSGANTPGSLACVITSSQLSVFLNGTGKNTILNSSVFPTSINRIGIGSLRYSGVQYNFLNGSVAEAAIWNVALTDAEIASLNAGFTPDQIRPQSLQFYAPLVRNLQDQRGGISITNNSTATVAAHPRIYT
jgi:hypothetical protein